MSDVRGPRPGLAAAADALGVARLCVAAGMPWALGGALEGWGPRWLPAALFVFAATSDFLDGRMVRAAGRPTRYGAALDNVADVAFVLATTGAGAAHGLVPGAVSAAIMLAFTFYVMATAWPGTRGAPWRLARSRIGHAGGVLNYALAGLIAGAASWPGEAWGPLLRAGSVLVIGVNVGAVVVRLVPGGATPPARVTPVAGSTARSGRSSA